MASLISKGVKAIGGVKNGVDTYKAHKETFDKSGGKELLSAGMNGFKSDGSGSRKEQFGNAAKGAAKKGIKQAILFYCPPLRIPMWIWEGQDWKLRGKSGSPKSKIVLGPGACVIRLFLRIFQELFALIVIGMYSVDLVKSSAGGHGRDPRWMYAVLLGVFSFVYAFVMNLPFFRYWRFFFVDVILFIMWLVVFGIFGKLYLPGDPEENGRMRRACYIVAITMVLWFLSAAHCSLGFWLWRREANMPAAGVPSDEENLAQNAAPPGMTQTEPIAMPPYPEPTYGNRI